MAPRESVAQAEGYVDKWAGKFGFGHYGRAVRVMHRSERDDYWAYVHFNPEEEFFVVEVVPDGTLPARQLENVIVHEMTHGLLELAKMHPLAEEIVCNRVARLLTGARGPNEWKRRRQRKLPAPVYPAASYPRGGELVEALPPRERHVIRRIVFEGASLAEVGRELELSKRQVGRIRDRALRRMGAALVKARDHG